MAFPFHLIIHFSISNLISICQTRVRFSSPSVLVIHLPGWPITGTESYFYMVALADWVTGWSPISNWRNFPAVTPRLTWGERPLGGYISDIFLLLVHAFSPYGYRRRDFNSWEFSCISIGQYPQIRYINQSQIPVLTWDSYWNYLRSTWPRLVDPSHRVGLVSCALSLKIRSTSTSFFLPLWETRRLWLWVGVDWLPAIVPEKFGTFWGVKIVFVDRSDLIIYLTALPLLFWRRVLEEWKTWMQRWNYCRT